MLAERIDKLNQNVGIAGGYRCFMAYDAKSRVGVVPMALQDYDGW